MIFWSHIYVYIYIYMGLQRMTVMTQRERLETRAEIMHLDFLLGDDGKRIRAHERPDW